jgi:hypothetical protein
MTRATRHDAASVVIYARYSVEHQDARSIDDQVRRCGAFEVEGRGRSASASPSSTARNEIRVGERGPRGRTTTDARTFDSMPVSSLVRRGRGTQAARCSRRSPVRAHRRTPHAPKSRSARPVPPCPGPAPEKREPVRAMNRWIDFVELAGWSLRLVGRTSLRTIRSAGGMCIAVGAALVAILATR